MAGLGHGEGAGVFDESWFGGVPAVGQLSDGEKAAYLAAVGDPEAPAAAAPATAPAGTGAAPAGAADRLTLPRLPFMAKRPFEHTGSAVGYIQPGDGGRHAIVDPREIGPERALIGTKVTVRLTQALVVRYPGNGVHEILLHFGAGAGSQATPENNFSSTIQCADGNQMPVGGRLLFSGIEVGEDGLNVAMFTVNVHSQGDVQLLNALQSDVFSQGLDLVTSAGPVVGLLSCTLISLATAIAKSSENRPVQRGLLALDLGRTLVDSAKLRLGSYVLAQAPAEVDGRPWSWNDYVYDQGRNAIVSAHDPAALIPFNYVAVGIAPLHR